MDAGSPGPRRGDGTYDLIDDALAALAGRGGELSPGDLVLMEEASMTCNPDLADVISQVAASGAKVILAGDTRQLQAVENGGGMALLADALGYVRLAESARFRAGWERTASYDGAGI